MSEENLDPLITECPNCDTRFRVTESQLQIAGGRVRCGACLVVFDGTAHLSLDGEDFVAGEESEDVDALLNELDEITAREPSQAPAMPNLSDVDFVPVSAEELASGHSEEAQDADEDEHGLPPELLALEAQFLAEMQGSKESQQNQARNPPADAAEKPVEHLQPITDESAADPAEEDTQSDWDESVAEDIWQTQEPQTQEPQTQGAESVPVVDQEIELQALHEPPPLSSPGEAAEQDIPGAVEESQSKQVSGHLPDYADVELELEPDTPDKRTWITLLLVLLGLVALPAQVLWFQFDTWTMNPHYRPIYETVCRVAGCELPPLRNITLIDAQKSVIRVHPQQPDARIVDVLMINNAEFAQPYPLIELLATNMRGQLIAGRRFKPEEYLRGEASGGTLMPSRTPVHVSLEIQDPGEDALNFEVKFR
jgi:predicted Zn finger-like uncharacterized protein